MFVSFITTSGMDVAFNSKDVTLVEKNREYVDGRPLHVTEVTLANETVVILGDQFETVVEALRLAEIADAGMGAQS